MHEGDDRSSDVRPREEQFEAGLCVGGGDSMTSALGIGATATRALEGVWRLESVNSQQQAIGSMEDKQTKHVNETRIQTVRGVV